MCSDMWDDHTEDIFESVTIEQAMCTPSNYWGSMTKSMQVWAKKALDACGPHLFMKFGQEKSLPTPTSKRIKFRRYISDDDIQETLVGGLICADAITLGHKSEIRSTVGRDLSGYGDCAEFDIQTG
ncbi:hypothetical protein KAR91_65435 [Candidatus Pacearchaeota archaeon]|nr:hypothetical protein [Candidatus Pacearchaeota archaeon]